jgi:hypothetical protein
MSKELIKDLEKMMTNFIQEESNDTLIPDTIMTSRERLRERLRLIGAGERNFGFIEKAADIARENPEFLPPNFSEPAFQKNIEIFEETRQLFWVLQQFMNAANELMLNRVEVCYCDALRIFGNLREQFRGSVPGAEVLYRNLLTFFRHRSPQPGEEQPLTIKKAERGFMKRIHGEANGEIAIIREKPYFSGDTYKVTFHEKHAKGKKKAKTDMNNIHYSTYIKVSPANSGENEE